MSVVRVLCAAAAAVLCALSAGAQPLCRFTVKVGIDRHSVDSLGGEERVREHIRSMFREVDRAFNCRRDFRAVYHFDVDWDAFYIYDGVSLDEVFKPHPDHDYLVVMDGYKSDSREVGGGWYGGDIQAVYHSRTHNDRFNSPFEKNAVDGIIHEFGHSRGMPDIYAMQVDAAKNPVSGTACHGVRCIMNYPYGERHWSRYAVNMIDLAADKRIEIDSLVAAMCPRHIRITLRDAEGKPVRNARIRLYPVGWYSYAVSAEPVAERSTGRRGRCVLPGDIYGRCEEFGLRYPNLLVEAESDGRKAYGWLPLYEVQNARFDGLDSYDLDLRLRDDGPSVPSAFDIERHSKH
ncbi:MAG: hypothetical protein K2J33_08000 [Alistipes sp.]|nr:hypothetical protein [Alistipes sp.]